MNNVTGVPIDVLLFVLGGMGTLAAALAGLAWRTVRERLDTLELLGRSRDRMLFRIMLRLGIDPEAHDNGESRKDERMASIS